MTAREVAVRLTDDALAQKLMTKMLKVLQFTEDEREGFARIIESYALHRHNLGHRPMSFDELSNASLAAAGTVLEARGEVD